MKSIDNITGGMFRNRMYLELLRNNFIATPERMDNKDVLTLCDYNIVYEVRLKRAIDKEWLVPIKWR